VIKLEPLILSSSLLTRICEGRPQAEVDLILGSSLRLGGQLQGLITALELLSSGSVLSPK
jgi:hypothetical protein